ncbi:hypothetical protein [Streptomyces sp. GMR22]|uniref:hypothetical protein n=1 Tax=Streptomyces sp. GMR22 TaxID=2759524 RepID=UPI0015FB86B6|nr:hypothetical protein [Streptomyces sp. GMR22]MBA6433859.1 hypothetical protein [Streptomyces sp. GMR22]
MKRRLPVAEIIAAGMAAYIGYQLDSYGVPLVMTVASSLAMFLAFRDAIHQFTGVARAVTHRCPDRGCDFMVRLTGASAAESRRWQEIAAAHPRHQ